MSYTTITELPEKQVDDLTGSEYLLLATQEYSYKATLDTINNKIIELTSGNAEILTNKIIDDVTNFVHANAIHIKAFAEENITAGTPVKLVPNAEQGSVFVAIAGANDTAIGVCEDSILAGASGEIMVAGILTNIDTSSYTEGDLLYAVAGALTNVKPTGSKIQFMGYVLDASASGRILVSGSDPYPNAEQISFDNTTSDLTSTNVQDALVELKSSIVTSSGDLTDVTNRLTTAEIDITNLKEMAFQQSTAPTTAEGASDGDIWMDTTTNTLNVYREYPIGTGVYRWEPLLYKWDDTVDGGAW